MYYTPASFCHVLLQSRGLSPDACPYALSNAPHPPSNCSASSVPTDALVSLRPAIACGLESLLAELNAASTPPFCANIKLNVFANDPLCLPPLLPLLPLTNPPP
jgi:hypothetical protein